MNGTKTVKELQVTTDELGTKDLDEVLDLAEEGLKDTTAALADGRIGYLDIPKFGPFVGKIKPALEGINNVWPEVKDLNPAEATHVFERVGTILALAAALMASAK